MAESRNRQSYSTAGSGSRKKQTRGGISPVLLILPAVIVLLALIFGITFSNRKKKEALESAEAESASIAASIAESESLQAEQKIDLIEFTVTEIPELNQLVQNYFNARLAGDTSAILEMYGRTDTSPDPVLEQKLKAQAAWIQTFRNIAVWDVPGVSEGDRLCLVQYDVDFRRTDTLAPGIMYFYAERNAEGGYRFVENLMKDRVDFMDAQLKGQQALDMIEDTNTRLKAALDSDSELALIYTSFQNGEIYRESNLDMDREQEVDLFLDPADSILVEGVEIPQPAAEESEAPAAEETAEPEPDAAETEAVPEDTPPTEETAAD